jgi:hypothetical protein
MLFPTGKIADVAGITDECRPAPFDVHHRSVQANRKEHSAVLFEHIEMLLEVNPLRDQQLFLFGQLHKL